AAVDGGEAEKEVAGGSGAWASGSGKIAGKRSAQSRLAPAAEESAPVGRLERQHLAMGRELGFDLRHWRGGLRRQNEFGRLVVDDSPEGRQVENMVGPHRTPERAFAAAGDDLERLLFRHRPANHILGFAGVRRPQDGHSMNLVQKRGSSGKRSLPAWTCT